MDRTKKVFQIGPSPGWGTRARHTTSARGKPGTVTLETGPWKPDPGNRTLETGSWDQTQIWYFISLSFCFRRSFAFLL
jgi:hypothetical protein